ncbi:MAG: hypothetical protein J5I90_15975 [Caldilineales bacterium]|nr:hypothetical protein [Caldilineales bacterium]
MLKRNRFVLIAIALLLSIFLAACGGGEDSGAASDDAGPAPTSAPAAMDTPQPAPTDTPAPAPTDTPEEMDEPAAMTLLEEALDSYRARGSFSMISTVGDAEPVEQTMEFESAYTKADNPYGFNMSMRMDGVQTVEDDPNVPESVQFYMVDDASYIGFGDQWLTTTREESGLEDVPSFIGSADDIVNDLDQLNREGKEKVNGIDTVHYSFEDPLLLSEFFGQGADEGDVTSLRGDIWVAEDGNYVVKVSFTAAATGVPSTDDEGNEVIADEEVTWTFEVYEVNSDVEITVPEGATALGEVSMPGFDDGTFPMPPDTTVTNSFPGLVSAASTLTEEAVVQFFDEQLADLGWTKDEGFLPTYTKDGVSITIMASPVDGGGVEITIFGE